ncbi:hypothetical protein ANRL1_00500 [Anaerolineae bacterium]|nr:hypothetical protein ANRL1_00500 [Anaerolineae bacterium]
MNTTETYFPRHKGISVSFSTLPIHRADETTGTPLKNQHGFTLVEMLVAILLMTVGIFALVGMQTVSMNANSISMKLSVATSLAQEVLEDIVSWRPNDSRLTTAGPQTYDLDPKPTATSITIQGAGTYSATYITTAGPTDGTVRVTVTVTGGDRSVTITGLKRTV